MTHRRERHVTDGGKPELDVVLGALSTRRARYVCYYLNVDDVGEIDDTYLAREVASWETGVEPSRVSTERVNRVRRELQEETLPGLVNAGFVTYDKQVGTVRYSDPREAFERLLRVCQSIEQPR
jgi:hypothetical protein